jgi:hypothetical protein
VASCFRGKVGIAMKMLHFANFHRRAMLLLAACLLAPAFTEYPTSSGIAGAAGQAASPRTQRSINEDWRFTKGDPPNDKTSLLYDVVRPWICEVDADDPYNLEIQCR